MTTETFEFKTCSRWSLAKRLIGVLFSRKMALCWEPPPTVINIHNATPCKVDVQHRPDGTWDVQVLQDQPEHIDNPAR